MRLCLAPQVAPSGSSDRANLKEDEYPGPALPGLDLQRDRPHPRLRLAHRQALPDRGSPAALPAKAHALKARPFEPTIDQWLTKDAGLQATSPCASMRPATSAGPRRCQPAQLTEAPRGQGLRLGWRPLARRELRAVFKPRAELRALAAALDGVLCRLGGTAKTLRTDHMARSSIPAPTGWARGRNPRQALRRSGRRLPRLPPPAKGRGRVGNRLPGALLVGARHRWRPRAQAASQPRPLLRHRRRQKALSGRHGRAPSPTQSPCSRGRPRRSGSNSTRGSGVEGIRTAFSDREKILPHKGRLADATTIKTMPVYQSVGLTEYRRELLRREGSLFLAAENG